MSLLKIASLAILLTAGCLHAQVQLLDIRIISNRNYSEYWNSASIIADRGDNLRLSFIAELRPPGLFSTVFVSPYNKIILDGDTLNAGDILPLKEMLPDPSSVNWYSVSPSELDTMYLNHPGYVSPFAYIPYLENPLQNWNDKNTVFVNTIEDFPQYFPGTCWFKVELVYGNDLIASPGRNDRYKIQGTIDYGGLNPAVFRISYRGRTGSQLLDNILLYKNIPLIGNPVSCTQHWSDHQTMQWIGGNLNCFIAAASEFLDRSLETAIDKLPLPEYNYFQLTDYYLKNIQRSGGFYYSSAGQEVSVSVLHFTQGDIMMTKDRIALFFQDNSPTGILNSTDLVLECNLNSLRIGPVSEMMGDTLSLIRWKERWPRY